MNRTLWAVVVAWALVGCESGAAIGATCDRSSECASPLVCRLARCRVDCTVNRDCPAGSDCLLDENGLGSCSLPADRGCTSGGSACPTPLTCANDECVNACTMASDCPADGECRAVPAIHLSLCVAPDRDDAGAESDAGADAPTFDGGLDASQAHDAALDAGPGPCAEGSCEATLSVGEAFACAIRSGGNVWCWGDNSRGQLGDGTSPTDPNVHMSCGTESGMDAGMSSSGALYDCSPTPVMVLADDGSLLSAVAIASAETSSCAITALGTIACWGGDSDHGPESGDDVVPSPRRAHTSPALGGGYVQIVAGRWHYCATRDVGGEASVSCWGSNGHGQFGLFGTGTPDMGILETGDAWALGDLAAGAQLTCMLNRGVVWCAGEDDNGGVGPMGTVPDDQPMPVTVTLPSPATALAVGDGFGCALLSGDQSVQCWGWGAAGSLGRDVDPGSDACATTGATSPCDVTPAPVIGTASTFDGLWAGGDSAFVCARDTSGAMWCWGHLATGACAFSNTECVAPERAAGFDGAADIAMGGESICAVFPTGRISCVGFGDYGELGGSVVARSTETSSPVDVCFGSGC